MSTNSLLLAPVGRDRAESSPEPLRVDVPNASAGVFDLFMHDDGALLAAPDTDQPPVSCGRLASLACRKESGEPAWYVIPRCSELGINGISPPLPVTRLEPGTLISVGTRFWMSSTLWVPEAISIPEELREKSCPVCGCELHLAPVVQCVCGRWVHLERPEDPQDKNALNCYLISKSCSNCGRPTSLLPQILPEIPERLLQPPDDDDWFPVELLEELEEEVAT